MFSILEFWEKNKAISAFLEVVEVGVEKPFKHFIGRDERLTTLNIVWWLNPKEMCV